MSRFTIQWFVGAMIVAGAIIILPDFRANDISSRAPAAKAGLVENEAKLEKRDSLPVQGVPLRQFSQVGLISSEPEAKPELAIALQPVLADPLWLRTAFAALLLAAGCGAARLWRNAEVMQKTTREMALAAEVAHFGMWEWDILHDRLQMTAEGSKLFQVPAGAALAFEEFIERIEPEDRPGARSAVREAMANGPLHLTCRLRLPDHSERWISASGKVDFDRAGKPVRMLCVCMDISERRHAEETAWKLSGKLIHAQEDERRRIARELHDDLNQQLAMLSVDMDLLGRSPAEMKEEHDRRLERAAAQVRKLSSEVHKLSYALHPAKLEQLGLVAAARSLCREMTQQQEVSIQFSHEQVPRDIPAETALGLYRVMQESLRNVVRHSHAKEAVVRLALLGGHLRLTVTDEGAGFDVDAARRDSGLGLISMEERVRLIRGALSIRSRPGAGTQITVDVPLAANAVPESAMAERV